jgi:hypothetical protein
MTSGTGLGLICPCGANRIWSVGGGLSVGGSNILANIASIPTTDQRVTVKAGF